MGLAELADEFGRAPASGEDLLFHSVFISRRQDPAWIRAFHGHSAGVWDVSMTRDGARALSASRELILWDVATGRAIQEFGGKGLVFTSVNVSSDGRRAIGGRFREASLWDVDSGAELWRRASKHDVEAVGFSPDDRFVLVASPGR